MSPPAHRQNAILDALRGEIIDGTYAAGQRLPTRSDLVTRFDASSVTVQRALDILIADGFVQPRGRNGTFVVDHPPHLHNYGLVIAASRAELGGEHLPQFYRALADAATQLFGEGPRTMSTYYGIASRDENHYPRLLHDVQARRLAGLVFTSNPFYLLNSTVLDLPGLPRLAIGTPGGTALPSMVDMDSLPIFDLALDRIAAKGRRRVAWLTVCGVELKHREYFKKALAKRGLETRQEWIQATTVEHPHWAEHLMRLLFRPGQEESPDALLISDDNLVGPATAGLAALGLRCPADLEVIAHANFPLPTASALPITRIGFDVRKLLRLCINDLDRQRRTPERATFSALAPEFAGQPDEVAVEPDAR